MSTRRFTELAAKLYPITEQNPPTRMEDLAKRIKPGQVEGMRLGSPHFAGLSYDDRGRLVVGFAMPFIKFQPQLVQGLVLRVQEKTMIEYGVPVRAFLRIARKELSDHAVSVAQQEEINWIVSMRTNKPRDSVKHELFPVYRDGLLALAKELESRKDARTRARSAQPETHWPTMEI